MSPFVFGHNRNIMGTLASATMSSHTPKEHFLHHHLTRINIPDARAQHYQDGDISLTNEEHHHDGDISLAQNQTSPASLPLSPSAVAEDTDTNECPLCGETYLGTGPNHPHEHPVQVTNIEGCNHIFGETCLRRWLDSGEGMANTCPICRAEFFKKGPRAGGMVVVDGTTEGGGTGLRGRLAWCDRNLRRMTVSVAAGCVVGLCLIAMVHYGGMMGGDGGDGKSGE